MKIILDFEGSKTLGVLHIFLYCEVENNLYLLPRAGANLVFATEMYFEK